MYIVANLVFYTSAQLNIKELKTSKNSNTLNKKNYWFNKFDKDGFKYLEFDFTNKIDIFSKKLEIEKTIKKLTIKVHLTGISSIEIYFEKNLNSEYHFNTYLDEFLQTYEKDFFDLVYDLNINLEKENFIYFPENIRFSTLILGSKSNNIELNKSFLYRIHYFTSNKENYKEIANFYEKEKIKSGNTVIEIEKSIFDVTIYKECVLWFNKSLKLDELSKLLDIDSITMNESIIYINASNLYTNLINNIDFKNYEDIDSNTLMFLHKTNIYFLQKIKLEELAYIDNVDGFIDTQKELEKFDKLEDIFEKSEKNYLEISEVVEENEKVESARTVQYILVFLTLFTAISLVQDIINFIDIGFIKEHPFEIDFISKFELTSLLIIFLLFIFLKISQYIKKS